MQGCTHGLYSITEPLGASRTDGLRARRSSERTSAPCYSLRAPYARTQSRVFPPRSSAPPDVPPRTTNHERPAQSPRAHLTQRRLCAQGFCGGSARYKAPARIRHPHRTPRSPPLAHSLTRLRSLRTSLHSINHDVRPQAPPRPDRPRARRARHPRPSGRRVEPVQPRLDLLLRRDQRGQLDVHALGRQRAQDGPGRRQDVRNRVLVREPRQRRRRRVLLVDPRVLRGQLLRPHRRRLRFHPRQRLDALRIRRSWL